LCWSLLEVTGVSCWSPRHVWEWWDSWGFWWAEGGGEGVSLGVLGEDGNVGIPGGLGGVVAGQLARVQSGCGTTGHPAHLSDLRWKVSDHSNIVFGGASGHSIAGGGGWGGCTIAGAWEVGDVTVVLTGNGGKGSGDCGTVLVGGEPV